jgi:D-proline reductase (dithiol) PrdB
MCRDRPPPAMVHPKHHLIEEAHMARMKDFLPAAQKTYQELECATFERKSFVAGPPLNRRRIAIVSSAGLLPWGE